MLVADCNYMYYAHVSDESTLVPTRLLREHPVLPVVVLCFGGLTASLTQTLLIPIQGELGLLLGSSQANAAWVITITLLAAAVAMPVAGRLADLFGKQRVLVASAGLLLVASVVCALSDSLAPMLVGRAMQGLAMGFIPVGISLMREITPPHLTGTAIAAMSATLGVGGAIGLPLSALVAQNWDWHALFWVAAALAALVVASVWFLVPHVSDAAPGRFDVRRCDRPGGRPGQPSSSASPRPPTGAGPTRRTLGCDGGRARRAAGLGPLPDAHTRATHRPADHRAPPGPDDERRRGGDRLRDDGPGDRRAPAAADARGDRLRPRASRSWRPACGWRPPA